MAKPLMVVSYHDDKGEYHEAFYNDYAQASRAVEYLKQRGITNAKIGVKFVRNQQASLLEGVTK